MRKLKKAFSLTLALVMCLGLTVPAFATGFEGDGESTWVEWTEPIKLTLEDVVFSVDPIGVVTIQFVYQDGSAGATVTAYMFDQSASINMKDGRDFMYGYGDGWENQVFGEGLYDGIYSLMEDEFFGIHNNSNGLWRFYREEDSTQYDSPYMVSKSYVDSLIAEGRHKVDIQPYTASQPQQPAGETASPTNDSLTADGVLQPPTVYKINGSNYFKIRDLAAILNGTGKQFSVGYDSQLQSVTATTGEGYTKLEGDLTGAPAGGQKTADPSNDAIYINGEKVEAEVYKIDGSNYFKLRDLGKALDFYVGWNQEAGVFLETDKPYSE